MLTLENDCLNKLTQSIENEGNTFEALCLIVKNNRKCFELDESTIIDYPPMKCLDMYLWIMGLELDGTNEEMN